MRNTRTRPYFASTNDQLKKAQEVKSPLIVVLGKLAKDVHVSRKALKAAPWVIGLVASAFGLAPLTGGLSLGAMALAAPVISASVGIPTLIIILTIGIGVILILLDDYEEVSFNGKKLVLRRKGQKGGEKCTTKSSRKGKRRRKSRSNPQRTPTRDSRDIPRRERSDLWL